MTDQTNGRSSDSDAYLAAALLRISKKQATAGKLMAAFTPWEKAILREAAARLQPREVAQP